MPEVHKILNRKGYIVTKAKLGDDLVDEICSELTVKPIVYSAFKQFGTKEVKYPIYKSSKSYLILPKYYAIDKLGPPVKNTIPKGLDINITCNTDVLPHQKVSWVKLQKVFDRQKLETTVGGDGGVLSIPCGYGKTFLAIKTICHLGKKALIVVNKEDLIDQWREEIETFTDAKVGIIQGPKVQVEGCDVVIGMLKSLSSRDYTDAIYSQFGMLVVDEAHHIAAQTFSQSVMKIRPRFTLGLSATPERRDGLSFVLYHYLGPIIHQERRTNSNQVLVKALKLVNKSSEHYEDVYMASYSSRQPKVKDTTTMETNLSVCPERNKLIVQLLCKLVQNEGRQMLVLGKRREQLENIKHDLESIIKYKMGGKYTCGFYWGRKTGSKKAHREMLKTSKGCNIVLGTVNIAKEALNIKSLNTLVFISNFGSDLDGLDQAVGRILRVFHKNINPVVLDIYDQVGNFLEHFRQRCKGYYGKMNYIVDNLTIHYDKRGEYNEKQLDNYIDVLDIKKMDTITDVNKSKPWKQDKLEVSGPLIDMSVCHLFD